MNSELEPTNDYNQSSDDVSPVTSYREETAEPVKSFNQNEILESLREGISAAKAGNREEARASLLRVVGLDENNETAWLWLASISEQPVELLGFLERVLSINPSNERALDWSRATKSLLAKSLLQQGANLAKEGNKEEALNTFKKAAEYEPQNELVWLWTASVADDVEDKLAYLQRALNINPNNEKALSSFNAAKRRIARQLLRKGSIAAVSGEPEVAREILREVMEYDENLEDAWLLKAYISDSEDDKIECFNKVLSLNPNNETALTNLSAIHAARQKAEIEALTPEAPEIFAQEASLNVEEPPPFFAEEPNFEAVAESSEVPEIAKTEEATEAETAQNEEIAEMQGTAQNEEIAEMFVPEPANVQSEEVVQTSAMTETEFAEQSAPEDTVTESNVRETAYFEEVRQEVDEENGETAAYSAETLDEAIAAEAENHLLEVEDFSEQAENEDFSVEEKAEVSAQPQEFEVFDDEEFDTDSAFAALEIKKPESAEMTAEEPQASQTAENEEISYQTESAETFGEVAEITHQNKVAEISSQSEAEDVSENRFETDNSSQNAVSEFAPQQNEVSKFAPQNEFSEFAPQNEFSEFAPQQDESSEFAPQQDESSEFAPQDEVAEFAPQQDEVAPQNEFAEFAPPAEMTEVPYWQADTADTKQNPVAEHPAQDKEAVAEIPTLENSSQTHFEAENHDFGNYRHEAENSHEESRLDAAEIVAQREENAGTTSSSNAFSGEENGYFQVEESQAAEVQNEAQVAEVQNEAQAAEEVQEVTDYEPASFGGNCEVAPEAVELDENTMFVSPLPEMPNFSAETGLDANADFPHEFSGSDVEQEAHIEETYCLICRSKIETGQNSCRSCGALLSYENVEEFLHHEGVKQEKVHAAIERLQVEQALRQLSAEEYSVMSLAYLNLKNFKIGYAHLHTAAQMKPEDASLQNQLNELERLLREIENGEKAKEPVKHDGKTILVVDDSPTVRKLISVKLEKHGHRVIAAADGLDALSIMTETKPDLILLDITMPRMDGYQLCKLVKGNAQTKNIPVIMISGKDGFFDKVRGRMAGSTAYITKPFGPETLIHTVETYCQ